MSNKDIIQVCDVFSSMLLKKISDLLVKSETSDEEYVSCNEAARILGISSIRLRARKNEFPHKKGPGQQGRLLFLKSALLENYAK